MTQQIVVALVLGTLLGWWLNAHFTIEGLAVAETSAVLAQKKAWLDWITLPRDIFLHLIKAMIAPLIFGSVVQGIAGAGDMKRVGSPAETCCRSYVSR
jgi:proton glutamate symport protein